MINEHPFITAARAQTMLRDFDRLRQGIRSHDTFATEAAWETCERWVDQLKSANPYGAIEVTPTMVEAGLQVLERFADAISDYPMPYCKALDTVEAIILAADLCRERYGKSESMRIGEICLEVMTRRQQR